MSLTIDAVHERWAALRGAEPRLRVRDAATRLGLAEAELVQSIPGARRLRADWPALLHALPDAGPVMALTRNAHCVHERHGRYEDVSVQGAMGLVLGPDIDLRLFLAQWSAAWFVPPDAPGSPRGSLQIFDAAGQAVHKIFAVDATAPEALPALAARFAASDAPPFRAAPRALRPAPLADAALDSAGLREAWRALRDTHDFFPMLRRFGATRLQAFRLAGPALAQPLANTALPAVITRAAEAALPIMIFVGNPGCIQIHTGPVRRVVPMEGWFNLLDPAFNLHLSTAGIAETWIVRKPTEDGVVTSIEAFDADGEVILMLFGARKPGRPEDPAWRALAEALAP